MFSAPNAALLKGSEIDFLESFTNWSYFIYKLRVPNFLRAMAIVRMDIDTYVFYSNDECKDTKDF